MILRCAFVPLIVLATISILQTSGRSININIVGGVPTIPGEFPSLVYIRYSDEFLASRKTSSFEYLNGLCVGSIRNHNQVITAAHCVAPVDVRDMMVVAGAYNITRNESHQQVRRVLAKTIHPEFHYSLNQTTQNDIAILTVESFEYNSYVSNLRLPPYNHVPKGLCWIAGWGETRDSIYSDILLKAQVPVIETARCSQIYPQLFIPSIHLCAGRDEGGYDACTFDTGGPLICNDLGYNYTAGIVAWGYYCAYPLYPGVYTKVSTYIDWMPSGYD